MARFEIQLHGLFSQVEDFMHDDNTVTFCDLARVGIHCRFQGTYFWSYRGPKDIS